MAIRPNERLAQLVTSGGGADAEGRAELIEALADCALSDEALERLLHRHACDCAEYALLVTRRVGEFKPIAESWAALDAKRRWLDGRATAAELAQAVEAALGVLALGPQHVGLTALAAAWVPDSPHRSDDMIAQALLSAPDAWEALANTLEEARLAASEARADRKASVARKNFVIQVLPAEKEARQWQQRHLLGLARLDAASRTPPSLRRLAGEPIPALDKLGHLHVSAMPLVRLHAELVRAAPVIEELRAERDQRERRYEGAGAQLSFDLDELLQEVRVFGPRTDDAGFTHPLPFGLAFKQTASKARGAVGSPPDSTGGDVHPRSGEQVTWDRWEQDHLDVRLEYGKDGLLHAVILTTTTTTREERHPRRRRR